MFGPIRSRLRTTKVARVFSNKSFRSTLFVFALSRTLVLTLFVLVGLLHLTPTTNSLGHTDVYVSASQAPIASILRQEVRTADVNWYIEIASNGYERGASPSMDVPHNWVFFPLFPLVLRTASYLTREFVFTGMLLSHVFFFVALFLLHRTCELFDLSEGDANRCIFYVAFFPVSYFFSLPLTESLFLMLTVGSFFFAKRGLWWIAGCLAAFSSATRPSGIVLLPALMLLHWQMRGRLRPFQTDQLAPLLAPVGLLSYMTFLYRITGNPLAFRDAQAAWGRKFSFFLTPLFDYLQQPLEFIRAWDFRVLNFAAAITVMVCGVALLKRRQFALAVFTLGSILLTLSSGLLQSEARYAMVVFPVFMVLATCGRRERFGQLISAIFLVLFGLLTALFAAHFTMALS